MSYGTSKHVPGVCECVRCRGIPKGDWEKRNRAALGNELHLLHGATSERRIRPLARNHRRRLLRQFGLRASEIDPVGKAYLELLSRTTAKIALIDQWVDEHGLIRDDGSLQPCMTAYVSLTNSSRALLAKLAEHLRVEEKDPAAVLALLRNSG
jgi:hypothetical protein